MWLYGANGLRQILKSASALRILNRVGASCLGLAGLFTLKAAR